MSSIFRGPDQSIYASSIFEQPQQHRGFFGTIAHETALDVEGAVKTPVAVLGSLFSSLGVPGVIPLTIDDLTTRDLKGAAMMATLGLTAPLGGVLKSTALAKSLLGTFPRVGPIALSAFTEATAGAAYGLITPLEDDQSRLTEVENNAAIFGAFGAGFGAVGSAAKAVKMGWEAKQLQVKGATLFANALQTEQANTAVREFAGKMLLNPETNARVFIRREGESSVKLDVYSQPLSKGAKRGASLGTPQTFDNFNDALKWSVERGYMQDLGPLRDNSLLLRKAEFLDAATRERLGANSISDALGPLNISEYSGVQAAAMAFKDSKDKLGALASEIIVPSDKVGVPLISPQLKQELAQAAGTSAMASNQEVLRSAFEKGVIDIESLRAGWNLNKLAREFDMNGRLPEPTAIHVSKVGDAFAAFVLLPEKLAKFFPNVAPLVQDAISRYNTLNEALLPAKDWLYQLQRDVGPEAAKIGRQIIDESASVQGVGNQDRRQLAIQYALDKAKTIPDPRVFDFVSRTTTKLDEYLTRLQGAGYLKEGGFAGYFPIKNIGSWRVEVVKAGKTEFRGMFTEEAEAKAAADAAQKEAGVTQTSYAPRTVFFDQDQLLGMDPKQYAKLIKAARLAGASSADAGNIASSMAYIGPGKKTTGALQQRVLGMTDFAEDPFESLDIYMNSIERTLAFSDFARNSAKVIDGISDVAQPQLKKWAQGYVDNVLGKPGWAEVQFQNIMDHMAPILGQSVQPRALSRYLSVLRNWESFSRLGGAFSGIVNLTQIAANTYPVLGARWTGQGIRELWGSKEALASTLKEIRDNGYKELGYYVPISGGVAKGLEELPSQKLGASIALNPKSIAAWGEEAKNLSMFAFNRAERTNRVVTAVGAYRKALSEGMDGIGAANEARKAVNRTQFNYNLAALPTILQGTTGKFLFQFKSFMINELHFMASLEKGERARFLASLMGMGGIGLMLNSPGGEIIDQASNMFSAGKFSEWLKAKTGDSKLGTAAVFGLPGLLGIDATDYVGVGNLSDIARSFSGPGINDVGHLAKFLYNSAIDLQSSGGTEITNDTVNEFLQKAMPSWWRRVDRAMKLLDTGEERNPYDGKLIYRPENRYLEAAKDAIGFPSVQMTQERTSDMIASEARKRYVKMHAAFAKEAAQAIRDGDNEAYQTVLSHAQEWGHPIDGRTISYWVKELSQTAAQRRMSRTPKEIRADIADLFSATGTVNPKELQGVNF